MTEEQKEHKRLQDKIYREKNKDKLSEYFKQYYLEHKESKLQQFKQYRVLNKEKIAIQNKQHYIDNKEVILADCKRYRALNKKRLREWHKQHHMENKDRMNLRSKKYYMDHKKELGEAGRQWKMNNKEKASVLNRKSHLKVKFGITPERYNEMFSEQEGRCAICGKHQEELKLVLGVDHDHSTGEIRGLLCGPCNRNIGSLKDDPDLLQKAIDYLRKDNKLRLVSGLD